VSPALQPSGFTYNAEGRRDPFVALFGNTGKEAAGTTAPVRAEGVAGIGTDELSVKGIMLSQGKYVAMVSGPAGKVYTVHPGDRLADGTIRGITPQFVVILQQVNTETVRLPIVFTAQNYAIAALIVTVAATVSALFVLRRLNQLDLIGALRAPE